MDRARALFAEGQTAYGVEQYEVALAKFREAYSLAPLPALLFNMAAALESLSRPGEAADKLRAYLRGAGEVDNRAEIEARVRMLDEAQRQLDLEKAKHEKPRIIDLSAVQRTSEERGRRRGLAIGLGVGGAVVLGVAIGLGVYFGTAPRYPDSTLGTQRVTP